VIFDREENGVVPEHRVPEPENDLTEDTQVLDVEPFQDPGAISITGT